eukprot:CAMPEP_0118857530 /NCGR_PEP_ID=MMETSP1163-20130328/4590_1 /TAXON_ID=124430 /ORGANISM="Phaeomonas parva, Strain CCMP2877" /LENGTH=71 /DNA_ID=CAMNT_0006790853 /DNA_START=151 /DNA_END=366 /DNA_ORIENTATION=+
MLASLARNWNRAPLLTGSIILAVFSTSLPLWLLPMRRGMGLPTEQYDGVQERPVYVPALSITTKVEYESKD